MKSLIPDCLQYMTLEQFWSYDIEEIRYLSDAYKARKDMELKDNIALLYQGATMVASFVGASFAGKPFPKIDKLYPSLFESTEDADIQKYENQMLEYAYLFNAKQASKEVSDK